MKQFKAESKRLLDLMINSIYTNKDIFLRELISNASDAIDKQSFNSLTDSSISREFAIEIKADKLNRTLTISDNGCGMTDKDLESNLGTIAQSGTLEFKTQNKLDDNLIGQFGVGFYSAFMAADKVIVKSLAYKADSAYVWESNGAEGYTIKKADKDTVGTEIVLHIKQNDDDFNYDDYLNGYSLKQLIKKYSDYIRYPIKMDMENSKPKEGSDTEFETVIENEILNSMVPIWKRGKGKVKKEEYDAFYKEKFHDYTEPAKVISANIEGTLTYNALLYIPSKPPYNYFSKEYEKGLQLYSNGVMIMEKCGDLLADYFSFIKGVVDSGDLSLNISREMLQKDRQVKAIEVSLNKKIKTEMEKWLKNDREEYSKFFESFGLTLKFGCYDEFGAHKDELKDLIMFYSSTEKKLVTLAEYVSRMKEGQKFVYYACGASNAKIDKLPQVEQVKDKGYEILYLTENVDEFTLKVLDAYNEKQFKSVSAKDLGLESVEEKEQVKKQSEENKDLFQYIKESLGGKVSKVRLSTRMKTYPVCLTTDGELSLEMEKVLNTMPNSDNLKADKVLEINANHKILSVLIDLYTNNKEKVADYAKLLYNQALLIEGLALEDVGEFTKLITDLMV